MELSGDIGAKPLMAEHRNYLVEVEVATNSIFADIDVPADLTRYQWIVEHLHLRRRAGAGSSDDAVAADWEVDEAGGDADPGAVVGIGVKDANSAGAVPGADGSSELNTLTSLGIPGPEPTMMLSGFVPSISVAVTLMPPRASGAKAVNRASSVSSA
jgi:hypothetical protein